MIADGSPATPAANGTTIRFIRCLLELQES